MRIAVYGAGGVGGYFGATTYEIDSSHVPMLSHPDYVTGVIRTAATSI